MKMDEKKKQNLEWRGEIIAKSLSDNYYYFYVVFSVYVSPYALWDSV